ncbi:uncharacterized protein V1518DRAFT_420143 [Limtongia smithiae]|uniref:uncharacterized protein n=1 Tax=Limtongia smithiae TaxID=1125753 RepID=UPI0034CD91E0
MSRLCVPPQPYCKRQQRRTYSRNFLILPVVCSFTFPLVWLQSPFQLCSPSSVGYSAIQYCSCVIAAVPTLCVALVTRGGHYIRCLEHRNNTIMAPDLALHLCARNCSSVRYY